MATRTGNNGNNTLTGTAAADRLNGLGGNDTLNGANGNDTLDGGIGNDRLNGGAGNDFYLITANPGTDTFVDSGGTDTVLSTVTYSIANKAMIENLTLQGTQAINGTGNEGGNTITGNSANNRLIGNGGSDKLIGGAASGKDTLEGGAGNDTLSGDGGNDSLLGSSGTDSLAGGEGNDFLDGGAGSADRLLGGGGKDILIWDKLDTARDGGDGADTLRVTTNGAVKLASEPIANMEIVDLAGDNSLKVSAANISAGFTNATLTVKGGAEDAVVAAGTWAQLGYEGDYAVYEKDGATLKVDLDINRSGIAVIASSLSLSTLDGTNGFRLDGVADADQAGVSVDSAGDFNGDGYDDFIIGANRADPVGIESGAAYVVFGGASGVGSSFDLTALDGTSGFRIVAAAGDALGNSVSSAGDVNGDGFGDLIVGAWYSAPNGTTSGASYVIFGAASGFGANFQVTGLTGTNGFKLNGAAAGDYAGSAVSGAGDVNGDGFADLVVGAYYAEDSAGAAYVVFGAASGFASALELGTLDGTNGFRLSGFEESAYVGISVSSAGDVNGDGYEDVIVGTRDANLDYGAAYVVFGRSDGFASNLDLSGLDGTNGFEIHGSLEGMGRFVSGGDINGDGLDDLIVSVDQFGTAFVVFGSASGFSADFHTSALDGTNGFVINQAGPRASVAAGDVNGDGYDDIVIGVLGAGHAGVTSGSTYVVYGQSGSFGSSFALSALDGLNGFRLDGAAVGDQSGAAAGIAGDLNGDGFADLIIGARLADPDGEGTGAAYVYFGGDFNNVVDFLGTAGGDSLTGGGAQGEVFVGGAGDDTMTGLGGADVFRGGEGDDRIVVGDGSFADVDGGNGLDTLAVSGELDLDLTDFARSRLDGIERVDLVAGGGDNHLTLTIRDLLALSGTSNTLIIDGDGDDTVTLDGAWSGAPPENGYGIYTADGTPARILIDLDINADFDAS